MARRSRRPTHESQKSPFPLAETRRKLEERREQLLSRRASGDVLRADLIADDVFDTADAAVHENFVDRFDQLEQGEFRELQAIDAALARIESGDYGFCSKCGQPIAPDRLRAIPETPLCRHCAEPSSAASQEYAESERSTRM